MHHHPQALEAEERVVETVKGAMVDCRREYLWNSLLRDKRLKDVVSSADAYLEFTELILLVESQMLEEVIYVLVPCIPERKLADKHLALGIWGLQCH